MHPCHLCRALVVCDIEEFTGKTVTGHLVPGRYAINTWWIQTSDPVRLHMIDKNTVCRCTGAEDRNGELIFQGDWIECDIMCDGLSLIHAGTVTWDDENCTWATKNDAGLTPFSAHVPGTRRIVLEKETKRKV